MSQLSGPNVIARTAMLLTALALSGCSSSIYGWQCRTLSSPDSPQVSSLLLGQEPVAIFGALAQPALQGNEIGVDSILAQVLAKVAPQIKVIQPGQASTLINRNGLAEEYAHMRNDALQTAILNRSSLRKLGPAIGARYVFQPRLTGFIQIMTQRWKVPGLELRVVETRSSIMRASLQLWDAETGDLLWSSIAEATVQNEAVSQDPVYFADAARITFGSIIADLLNRKTASAYSPLDLFIDQLIQKPNRENDKAVDKSPGGT